MSNPLFISYFTPFYADRAKEMVRSAEEFGLPIHAERRPESKNADLTQAWLENVRPKAQYILELKKRALPGDRGVVWLDADCVVRQKPDLLLSEDYDVAAVRWKPTGVGPYEVSSGTVGFGPTRKADEVLSVWRQMIDRNPKTPTQPWLGHAIDAVSDARVLWLPISYYYIFDTHRLRFPEVEPVIEHFQHSRVAKVPRP